MSLDVYLEMKGFEGVPNDGLIYIRQDGKNKPISRAEWDALYPDREPHTAMESGDSETVYHDNITHNLNTMAREAGVYEYLWRPDELDIKLARELIEPLEKGLALLRSDPERFEKFNPDNGWGNYIGLVEFVENYLSACKMYPDSEVRISR